MSTRVAQPAAAALQVEFPFTFALALPEIRRDPAANGAPIELRPGRIVDELTTAEAGLILRVDQRTIQRMIDDGILRARKKHRRVWLVRAQDVAAVKRGDYSIREP